MKKFVISLGGSLIVPQNIDEDFLMNFRQLILSLTNNNNQFYLITGGGRTARNYINSARVINPEVKAQDLDWLGISATKLNAQLIKTIFGNFVHEQIYQDPNQVKEVSEKICLLSGWKPGWSTDYDAVLVADKLNIKTVINLSNIDYVYDKDPNKFTDAQKIEKISWLDFKKIVGNEWQPGANLPFDPLACKLAEEKNIRVVILNGKNMDNLKNYFDENDFIGTIIG